MEADDLVVEDMDVPSPRESQESGGSLNAAWATPSLPSPVHLCSRVVPRFFLTCLGESTRRSSHPTGFMGCSRSRKTNVNAA